MSDLNVPEGRRAEEFYNDDQLAGIDRARQEVERAKWQKKMSQRPWFRLRADFRFQAHDLDDAFWQLREHFANLRGEDEAAALELIGEISIEPDH